MAQAVPFQCAISELVVDTAVSWSPTPRRLITGQMEAGWSADRIAERWETALTTHNRNTATPAERQWHAGAQ